MTDKSWSEAQQEHTALLVIDVQQGMFGKSIPVYQAEQLLQNINLLIDQAHAAGVSVIFVQHCDNRALVKGSPDWQLHQELHFLGEDAVVLKEHGNAFEKTGLDEELKGRRITTVVVTGLVTHGCVKNSCLGALALGYKVVLAADGHSSFSKDAAGLIEEWNGKLGEQDVRVVPAVEIVFN